MARIRLLTGDGDTGPERQEEVDAIHATLGHLSGPFAVLMHSPGLAMKVMQAGAHVRLESTLERWQRELAILAVAVGKQSDFEWASHVELARKAGVGEAVINAVRGGGPVPDEPGPGEAGPDAADAADVVAYVRQLVAENRVDQPVYDRLVERHGERWLVELTATVGQYQYIATMLGAFEVEPGAGKERIHG